MHRRIVLAALLLLAVVGPFVTLRASEQPRIALPLLRDGRPKPLTTSTPATTPSASSTPAPTSAPTATATPSPTATSAPAPCAAAYPLAINASLIAGDQFKPPPEGSIGDGWRVLTSGPFAGRTARLVRVDGSDEASFLRWKADVAAGGQPAVSSTALQDSMRFPGNLAAGFEEAPWPDATPPTGYPDVPGQLNVGDWVYGSAGYRSSLNPIFDDHVVRQSQMVLPVVNSVVGSGRDRSYRVGALQVFALLGHQQRLGEMVLDLVMLGEHAAAQPCPPAPTPATLRGDVSLWPEYAEMSGNSCTPRRDQYPRNSIPASHFPAAGAGAFIYPQVGEVVMTSEGDAAIVRLPIIADVATGMLTFRHGSLGPGSYRLTAGVLYKHPLDVLATGGRTYTMIAQGDGAVESLPVIVEPGADAEVDFLLELAADPCAAP